MTSWMDDKDLGPWAFTEQGDKWGYLNDKRWSNQSESVAFAQDKGLEVDPGDEHNPCGHWHKFEEGYQSNIPLGEWKAALSQPGSPYIYLYDIDYYYMIKVDTSLNPPAVVQILTVNDANYVLDYDTQPNNNPGSQRGGYCMSRDGTRIWYFFRDSVSGDAKLVEVDITDPEITDATVFKETKFEATGLFASDTITDGCTDDTYTYWSTDDLAGRIIKLENATHSIIDDHVFNYPINPGPPLGSGDNPIYTLDVDYYNDKLYWLYVRYNSNPFLNATGYYVRANTDFTGIVEVTEDGLGVNTPWSQNFIRVYSTDILIQQRVYHPSTGYLIIKDNSYTPIHTAIEQEYMLNILGIKDGYLYTLWHLNAVVLQSYIYKINIGTGLVVDTIDVSWYTGHQWGAIKTTTWVGTGTGALNHETGRMMIFRWDGLVGDPNAVNQNAAVTLDSDLNILYDTYMHYQLLGRSQIFDEEPMVWETP